MGDVLLLVSYSLSVFQLICSIWNAMVYTLYAFMTICTEMRQ
jgi:hypothetical protein